MHIFQYFWAISFSARWDNGHSYVLNFHDNAYIFWDVGEFFPFYPAKKCFFARKLSLFVQNLQFTIAIPRKMC